MFVERMQFTVLRNIELPYLQQMPRGVKKIDELRASTVGSRELTMSMRYWWLSNCMEDSSVHVMLLKLLTARRIRLYTAMPTRSALMHGLADGTYCLESSTLAMSNSEELYAGKSCTRVLSAWHVHVQCSWTATVSSSSHIFCSTNLAIILEGRPEPGLLPMLPVSWWTTLTLVKGTVTNRTNT